MLVFPEKKQNKMCQSILASQLVFEMTYIVSMGTLKLCHSLLASQGLAIEHYLTRSQSETVSVNSVISGTVGTGRSDELVYSSPVINADQKHNSINSRQCHVTINLSNSISHNNSNFQQLRRLPAPSWPHKVSHLFITITPMCHWGYMLHPVYIYYVPFTNRVRWKARLKKQAVFCNIRRNIYIYASVFRTLKHQESVVYQ